MEGTIYAFRNKLNGKYYVGQTTDVKRRRSKHFRAASGCWLFNRAMLKYGRDAFEFIILESGVQSQEDLDSLEMKHIAETKAYPKGYNLTPGGNARSEEQNRLTSESTKARWSSMTEEQRRAISEKCSAKAKEQWAAIPKESRSKKMTKSKAIAYFTSINKEIREAHKAALDSVPKVYKPRHTKKVICVETNVVYESSKHAGKALKISPRAWKKINEACRTGVGCRGYHWKYAS